MEQQKKIALINDITGFGRCSIAVELPLISALKVQACPLPTAILSVHTGFPTYFIDDYTDRMKDYIASWKENGLTFDGISTGFMNSLEQIDIVIDFIHQFKQPHTIVIVDPVMGDYGRLYPSYTEKLCAEMRRLMQDADVITPNLTEACQLLGIPYPEKGHTDRAYLQNIARRLAAMGPGQIVITGLAGENHIDNYIYETGKEPEIVSVQKIGHDRSGTGDAFAAIVSASVVRGDSLKDAVVRATDFISRTLVYTEELGLPTNRGLAFEQFLTELH